MLQAIRSKTASIVVKALAGLLILSFAVWGVEDFVISRASDHPVASVGELEIDPLEFEYELDVETRQMRRLLGGQLTDEQLRQIGIGNAVLERMINASTLNAETGDLGLFVSDEQVARQIQSDPNFNGFDGQFSRTRFYEVIRSLGLSEAGYVERVRADMAADELLGLVGTAPALPSKLNDMLRAYRYESRKAEMFAVKAADQTFTAEPAESDLRAFHDAQKERFTAPEYRKINFVHLDPAQLTAGLDITDEELQTAYEANIQQFVQPETRTVQQMVLTDQAKADEAAKQLAEGRDFAEVAKEIAEMSDDAIEFGTVGREGLLPNLADAVFAVDEGAVTEPISSPLGIHILRAAKVHAGEEKTLDEVKDEVRDIVAAEKSLDALYDLSARFEDQIGGGATLEEAGTAVGFDSVLIAAVDRRGGAPDGSRAQGLPDVASLLPIAFSSELGIESPLTEAGDKGFFMVRVDDVIAPALRPLETVRDDVAAAWKDAERLKLAEQRAKELADKAAAGTSIADLAAEVGAEEITVGPITRSGPINVAASVKDRIFELSVGSAGIAYTDDGYNVIKVTEQSAALGGTDGVPDPAAFKDQLAGEVGQDLTQQMLFAMRNSHGVSINQNIFDAVMEPGPYDPYHGQNRQQ